MRASDEIDILNHKLDRIRLRNLVLSIVLILVSVLIYSLKAQNFALCDALCEEKGYPDYYTPGLFGRGCGCYIKDPGSVVPSPVPIPTPLSLFKNGFNTSDGNNLNGE